MRNAPRCRVRREPGERTGILLSLLEGKRRGRASVLGVDAFSGPRRRSRWGVNNLFIGRQNIRSIFVKVATH